MDKKIIEQALEHYLKVLEKENEILKEFAQSVSNVIGFDSTNPDKTDNERVKDIIYLLNCYKGIFDDD